ncbi:MAG: hypothetical protein JNJ45_08020 [Chthonomonas sp.]|nr:hypothetical protein [Chthonomonas sp.]
MVALALCSTILQGVASAPVKLTFAGGQFQITDSAGTAKVAINRAQPKPSPIFALKAGASWVVWDKRGLTIRTGKQVRTTHFEAIARSPKVLTGQQMRDNAQLFASKERTDRAVALSGDEFVGDTLYLVPRWEDRQGKPWLEALVAIDLKAKVPAPRLVGKIPGLSRASGPLSDELHRAGKRLLMVAENAPSWGLAEFNLNDGFGMYAELGADLSRYSLRPEEGALAAVERTTYNAERAIIVALDGTRRMDIAESRGTIRFISLREQLLQIDSASHTLLRNGFTGQELRFAPGTALMETPRGLLAWSPADQPQQAVLYRPETFTPLAAWRAAP